MIFTFRLLREFLPFIAKVCVYFLMSGRPFHAGGSNVSFSFAGGRGVLSGLVGSFSPPAGCGSLDVIRALKALVLLLLVLRLVLRLFATASGRAQWAVPDFNTQHTTNNIQSQTHSHKHTTTNTQTITNTITNKQPQTHSCEHTKQTHSCNHNTQLRTHNHKHTIHKHTATKTQTQTQTHAPNRSRRYRTSTASGRLQWALLDCRNLHL